MTGRQILLFGGLTLAVLSMSYGFWYAIFAEHQALEGMDASLSSGFQSAARQDTVASEQVLLQYRRMKYNYDRQVDAHSHWIGLAMLLVVLAMGLDYVELSDYWKRWLASILFLGSLFFPLGVLMQTWSDGFFPKVVAAVGAGMVIASLAAMVFGVLKKYI